MPLSHLCSAILASQRTNLTILALLAIQQPVPKRYHSKLYFEATFWDSISHFGDLESLTLAIEFYFGLRVACGRRRYDNRFALSFDSKNAPLESWAPTLMTEWAELLTCFLIGPLLTSILLLAKPFILTEFMLEHHKYLFSLQAVYHSIPIEGEAPP